MLLPGLSNPNTSNTPTQQRGEGNPLLRLCLALTEQQQTAARSPLRSLWKQKVCARWNLTQLFWECWGASVGREWRKIWKNRDIEKRAGSDIRMRLSPVEFLSSNSVLFLEHNCLVFGSLPPPLHFSLAIFCSFCPVDLSVPIYVCPSSRAHVLSLWDTQLTFLASCHFYTHLTHFFSAVQLCAVFFFSQTLPLLTSTFSPRRPNLWVLLDSGSQPNVDSDCPSQTPGMTGTEKRPPRIQLPSVLSCDSINDSIICCQA